MRTMRILDVTVHNITLPQALKKAEGFLCDKKQHYIVTPNPEIVLRAKRDATLRSILNKSDLSLPDGTGLVWASRVLWGEKEAIKQRVAGVDFLQEFLGVMSRDGSYRVLFLGGRNGATRGAAVVLREKAPQLDFYALENIKNKNIDFLIREIIQPDCVFVGLGAPKQENWIRKNLSRYPTIKIAMGVGGSFDIISGRIPRAPLALQRAGMEWAWRLLREPWRVKRIWNAVVIFPLAVFGERVR